MPKDLKSGQKVSEVNNGDGFKKEGKNVCPIDGETFENWQEYNDHKMTEHSEAKLDKADKVIVSGDESQVKKIMKEMNALDYFALENHIEKKQKKEENKVVIATTSDDKLKVTAKVNVEDKSFIQKVADQVMTLIKGKPNKQAVSADAQKWISSKIKYLIEEEGLTQDQAAGKAYGMARQEGYDIPEKKKSSLRAEFTKNDEFAKSTWALFHDDQKLIEASLGEIWGDTLDSAMKDTKVKDWPMSKEYGDALLARLEESENIEKFADSLGLKSYKQTDVKDSKVKMTKKKETKYENKKEDSNSLRGK